MSFNNHFTSTTSNDNKFILLTRKKMNYTMAQSMCNLLIIGTKCDSISTRIHQFAFNKEINKNSNEAKSKLSMELKHSIM